MSDIIDDTDQDKINLEIDAFIKALCKQLFPFTLQSLLYEMCIAMRVAALEPDDPEELRKILIRKYKKEFKEFIGSGRYSIITADKLESFKIRVFPKEIVMTPAGEIDKAKWCKELNKEMASFLEWSIPPRAAEIEEAIRIFTENALCKMGMELVVNIMYAITLAALVAAINDYSQHVKIIGELNDSHAEVIKPFVELWYGEDEREANE